MILTQPFDDVFSFVARWICAHRICPRYPRNASNYFGKKLIENTFRLVNCIVLQIQYRLMLEISTMAWYFIYKVDLEFKTNFLVSNVWTESNANTAYILSQIFRSLYKLSSTATPFYSVYWYTVIVCFDERMYVVRIVHSYEFLRFKPNHDITAQTFCMIMSRKSQFMIMITHQY